MAKAKKSTRSKSDASKTTSKAKKRSERSKPTPRFSVRSFAERIGAQKEIRSTLKQIEKVSDDVQKLGERVAEGVHDKFNETAERAQKNKLVEELSAQLAELEKRAEAELDEILTKVGLIRLKSHDVLVEKAKKNAVRAERRRAKKAAKEAEKADA